MNSPEMDDFNGFAAATRPRLVRQAYNLCRDWHEAEDLAQDTLIKLYRRWPLLRRRDELHGYARAAMMNVFLNSRRSSRVRNEAPVAVPDDQPDLRDEFVSLELRYALLPAMRQLGAAQQSVIVLRFWADMSVERVARVMGIPRGTVTSHAHRAIASMRARLTDDSVAD
jgi:RNA polymerase sigma-70 factor (sigma-E family)